MSTMNPSMPSKPIASFVPLYQPTFGHRVRAVFRKMTGRPNHI